MAVASVLLAMTLALASACSSGNKTKPPTKPASTSVPRPSTTTSPARAADKVALGKNNPSQGDCSSNLSEAATSVGFVILTVTTNAFEAKVQLQAGAPNTTYGVFLQQVPGSCPQQAANGGTLTTDSTGRGKAVASVQRVPGATTFFVQLVPTGSGPSQYTSDRISRA